MNKITASLAGAGALVLTAGALSGCSSLIDELAHHQRSGSYAALADVPAGELDAPWLPADATEIELTRTTDADASDAAVLVQSETDLDAALCAPVERQSAPAYALEGAPDVYKISDAFACGTWTVVATEDGWLGWTPGDPDETALSPAAAR